MLSTTQTGIHSTQQHARTSTPVPALQATQAMRPLTLDELRAVAGGPVVQNQGF